jgi:hypothetical protein
MGRRDAPGGAVTAWVDQGGGRGDDDERRSPYQGLVPYTEADADYFFGREVWTEVVTDNLLAYRLTVLYGESGVGKSSLLYAGAARRLRERERAQLERRGAPEHLLVAFALWKDDPLAGVEEAIRRAVASLSPELAENPPRGDLTSVIAAWSEKLDAQLLFVLDQFDEYFVYHRSGGDRRRLDTELARLLASRDLPASFLIAIREDAVAKLDRFTEDVPHVLDNLLRVEHLDRTTARDAIVKPLAQWKASGGAGPSDVEGELMDTVLEQVETGRVLVALGGRGAIDGDGEGGNDGGGTVEAPYLQLVMTRLWDEERRAGSSQLTAETLARLGGAERIVRTHVDERLAALPRKERDLAARIFRYLVTPSGTKIAVPASALAQWADRNEAEVATVLAKLAGDVRILRTVPAPDDDPATSSEIFHDLLGPAILDWRARYFAKRTWRRLRRGLVALGVIVAAVAIAIAAISYQAGASDALASVQVDRVELETMPLRTYLVTKQLSLKGSAYSEKELDSDVIVVNFDARFEHSSRGAVFPVRLALLSRDDRGRISVNEQRQRHYALGASDDACGCDDFFSGPSLGREYQAQVQIFGPNASRDSPPLDETRSGWSRL